MNNSSDDNKPLVLVTGGASGMGRAIVERLARDGWRVVMADYNGALAERETQQRAGQGELDGGRRRLQVVGDRRQRRQVHVDGEGADGGEQAQHDGVTENWSVRGGHAPMVAR